MGDIPVGRACDIIFASLSCVPILSPSSVVKGFFFFCSVEVQFIYHFNLKSLIVFIFLVLNMFASSCNRCVYVPAVTTSFETASPHLSYTVFGRALANAVRGGAATPDSDYVTVKQSFRFLLSFMKKEIMRINAAAAAGFENPDDEIAGAPVVNMSPVLFIPPKNQDALNNPICFRCGPPAAPERPYVSTATVPYSLPSSILPFGTLLPTIIGSFQIN